MKTALCEICEQQFSTSRYGMARMCSAKCRGQFKRRATETQLRLDAFDEWTPDMAYALGLIFSDGNITKPAKGSWRIQFVSTDEEQARWFHNFVGNPNKIIRKTPKQREVCGTKLRKTPKVQHASVTVSDTLVGRLLRLGIRPRKSKTGTRMVFIPELWATDFLRGVCDGDGWIMSVKNRKMPGGSVLRAGIACGPRRDLVFLSRLLDTLGVPHSVTSTTVRMDGSQAELFCKAIYAGTGMRLARKYKIWQDWCAMRAKVGGLISERDPYEPLRGLRPQPWHKWFGKLTDQEISERVGLGISDVARSRKLAGFKAVAPTRKLSSRPWHALVGTMPDSHIATKFNLSPVTVLHYRRKLAIPVYTETQMPAWHALVGTMPDVALARQVNVHRDTIANHRRRYDLPAARSL
jgi:hypothetical protein